MTEPADNLLLKVSGLQGWYGESHVLHGIDFEVRQGEVVTLLGRNGAGKTSTLLAIMGILAKRTGSITFQGTELIGMQPRHIARLGIALCPEERGIFSSLSVEENLMLPPRIAPDGLSVERIYDLFPNLYERRKSSQGTKLSGGEQQMCAIGRALMSRPKLLLLDEPSLGLAPLIVKQIFEIIKELNSNEGLTVFLVEQNAFHALKLAHRGYVMVNGNITMSGTGAELLKRDEVRAAYLEGGAH